VETTTKPTIDASINNLPELAHPAPLSLSSSEVHCRLKSDSSLDSHFENLIFSNFEIPICSTDTTNVDLKSSQFFKMESDYQDSQATMDQRTSSSPNEEIIQMLTAILTRMVSGQQDLQNQLIRNDSKLEAELQRVRDDNEKFRQELRQEFITSIGAGTSPTNNSVLPTSSPPSSSVNITSSSPNISQSADFQTQMLAVLNDTFRNFPVLSVIHRMFFMILNRL